MITVRKFLNRLLSGKGLPMEEVKCPEVEQAVRDHISAIRAAQIALDKALETSCVVLEKIRPPFFSPTTDDVPEESQDVPFAPNVLAREYAHCPDPLEIVTTPTQFPAPFPGSEVPFMAPLQVTNEPVDLPVVQGVRYDAAEGPSLHTAVIRYE